MAPQLKLYRPAIARRIFWAVVISAAVLKLILAFSTVGTNDVLFFQAYAAKVKSEGALALYRDGIVLLDAAGKPRHDEFFAHPPLIIHLLQFLTWAQAVTGLSFPFLFRFLSIAADVGSAWLLKELLEASVGSHDPVGGAAESFVPACLFAGAPLSIMLSGFHGNTDPIMVFFLLLAVWCWQKRQNPWLAGVAFGIGSNIKIWPLILVPAIVLAIPGLRNRLLFSVSALATWVLGSLPVTAQDPVFIARKTLTYASLSGHWGLSRLLPLTGPPELHVLFDQAGRWFVMAAAVGLSVWLYRKNTTGMPLRIGLLTSMFLVFTPGFGIQYLSWLLPWAAFLGTETLLIYLICTSLFMFHVYTFWSNGMPWNIADSTIVGDWKGFIVWHELLSWIAVVFCFVLFCQKCGIAFRFPRKAVKQPVSQPAELKVMKKKQKRLVKTAEGKR